MRAMRRLPLLAACCVYICGCRLKDPPASEAEEVSPSGGSSEGAASNGKDTSRPDDGEDVGDDEEDEDDGQEEDRRAVLGRSVWAFHHSCQMV